jgi:hypothetical protein
MTLERPVYWLVYVPESTETGPPEITAVAPEVLPRELLSTDTEGLLATVEAFHAHHPDQRVVFAAAVTRWLHEQGFEWRDLGVAFFGALRELDERAPALLIEATQLSMAVVASTAKECTIHWSEGGTEPLDRHREPVRSALLQALKRDWPDYIRSVARTAAPSAASPPEASL